MTRKRFYVGLSAFGRRVFAAATTPTASTHPECNAVIGPFRTKRGAEFMRDYGGDNPHCRNVAEAECLAARKAEADRDRDVHGLDHRYLLDAGMTEQELDRLEFSDALALYQLAHLERQAVRS